MSSLIKSKFTPGILFHNLYWIGSIILSVVIISSVVISTVVTIGKVDDEQFIQIPISIAALEEANYADGIEAYVFPGIEISIVKEVLSDLEVGEQSQEELTERVSLVEEQLLQPVPLATNPTTPIEEGTTNNPPILTESVNPFTATVTTSLLPSSTITNTSTFTQSPTNTLIASLIPVTGTSTSTLQPGNNPTFTLTPSLTSSLTPTFTLTPSFTNSLTPTYTLTPSLTNSLTPTFTLTPSLTSSLTPTFTLTPSLTNSLTPSLTNSLTPTYTLTPSLTSSLTPTYTLTPSLTSSQTPTFTRTPTFTLRPSLTSSLTPTITLTPSLTLTPTFTATNTLTPSLTPTSSLTPTPTATIATCNLTLQDSLLRYIWPSDGSINVPTTIHPVIVFNQSMNANTLTYGDANHIVICEKVSDSSNSCRNGTEVPAQVEILSVEYRNDWVNIYLLQPLKKGIVYTLFAGNQIIAHPDCSSYSKPLGGRVQSNFITVIE